jgi:farnesyl diphosphate synthase
MLEVSVHMGAVSAGADAKTLGCLERYAQAIGLAFQVVDDILDVTADSATLGKTAGKDQANEKPTFVSLLGLDGAKTQAQALLQEALQALDQAVLHDDGGLRALAHMVVQRDH